VSADERQILGERHVTFECARTHAEPGLVRFERVLGVHDASAAVADGKARAARLLSEAALEPRLQRPLSHIRDQQGWAGAELDRGRARLRSAAGCQGGQREARGKPWPFVHPHASSSLMG
jgi:hypothetical protein